MAARTRDFDLDGKLRIARAVRRVEATPADYTDVTWPTFPRTRGPVWVYVDGKVQDGTKRRWKYTGYQVELVAPGFDQWQAKAGGMTATGTAGNGIWIYNTYEAANGATGVYGNGVDSANLSGTGLELKPIPTTPVVPIEVRQILTLKDDAGNDVTLWLVSYPNAIDGPCTAP